MEENETNIYRFPHSDLNKKVPMISFYIKKLKFLLVNYKNLKNILIDIYDQAYFLYP